MLATEWPEWLTAPAVAAAVAASSYLAKLVVGAIDAIRRRRAELLTQLIQLEAVLDASRAAHLTQRDLRNRLLDLLRAKHPETYDDTRGAEWNLQRHFQFFDDDERALHRVIRGYTEHAIRPLNIDTLAWLDTDDVFRAGRAKQQPPELTDKLRQLHKHLLLWVAKYEVWIPDEPHHALVYMADEERHGIGFPRGIEDVVRATITAYQGGPPDPKPVGRR